MRVGLKSTLYIDLMTMANKRTAQYRLQYSSNSLQQSDVLLSIQVSYFGSSLTCRLAMGIIFIPKIHEAISLFTIGNILLKFDPFI